MAFDNCHQKLICCLDLVLNPLHVVLSFDGNYAFGHDIKRLCDLKYIGILAYKGTHYIVVPPITQWSNTQNVTSIIINVHIHFCLEATPTAPITFASPDRLYNLNQRNNPFAYNTGPTCESKLHSGGRYRWSGSIWINQSYCCKNWQLRFLFSTQIWHFCTILMSADLKSSAKKSCP